MKIKPREIDLLNDNHLKFIIEEIEGKENKDRKRAAWKSFQVESGNQAHYVTEELKNIYPDTYTAFRKGNINLVKKVVDKLSKAYKQQPIRALDTDGETQAYNKLFEANGFNRAFKEGDRIFNQYNYLLYWLSFKNPEVVNGEMRYFLSALAPYEYDLMLDEETGEPLIFILSYPDASITGNVGTNDGKEQGIKESNADTSAEHTKYSIWNFEQHVQVLAKRADRDAPTVDIEYIEISGNAENKNPTPNTLPIAFLSTDLSIDYPTPNNLAEQSIDWNVSLSDLKTGASAQGHGQLVIEHPKKQPMNKVQRMGMHRAIALPQSDKPEDKPTKAYYINAAPDLAGQLEVLKFDAAQILDDHGIKAKGVIEGGAEEFASGFDRLLSEADVQDVIEDNQSLYSDNTEQGIYNVIKAFDEQLNKKVFKSKKLAVTFEKPKVLISDKETLENIKLREELGLDLPWEKHLIMNPNLSEKEAQAREEEIAKFKAEKLKEAQKNMPEVVEDDGDSNPFPPKANVES